jgi:hypothetical protein
MRNNTATLQNDSRFCHSQSVAMHLASFEEIEKFLNSSGENRTVVRDVRRITIQPMTPEGKERLLQRQRDHWQKLHTTQFTPEEFEAWIASIPGCSTCQRNLRRRLETLLPRYDDWNRFTWELHNAVNKEIGKPEFTWLEACQQWGW